MGHKTILDGVRKMFLMQLLSYSQNISINQKKSKVKPRIVIDYYKAPGLNGENIYTHFYVDDSVDKLVINSFKEI